MRTLMVIGHPGHEIAAYHFAYLYQPLIYCLTDGSSGNGTPRHHQCHWKLLDDGLKGYINIDSVFKEADIYDSILNRNFNFWEYIISSLKEMINNVQPEIIAFDAYEGYSPIHDLLHVCIFRASQFFCAEHTQTQLLEIKLTDNHYSSSRNIYIKNRTKTIHGCDQSIFQKNKYAVFLSKYIAEIPCDKGLLEKLSQLSEEYIVTSHTHSLNEFMFSLTPFYESHAKTRAKQGKYKEAIEFKKHIMPLLKQIIED